MKHYKLLQEQNVACMVKDMTLFLADNKSTAHVFNCSVLLLNREITIIYNYYTFQFDHPI